MWGTTLRRVVPVSVPGSWTASAEWSWLSTGGHPSTAWLWMQWDPLPHAPAPRTCPPRWNYEPMKPFLPEVAVVGVFYHSHKKWPWYPLPSELQSEACITPCLCVITPINLASDLSWIAVLCCSHGQLYLSEEGYVGNSQATAAVRCVFPPLLTLLTELYPPANIYLLMSQPPIL